MRQLVNPAKQKFIVVLVAVLVSFLGLQAAGQAIGEYQIAYFFKISFYVYFFLIFWQTFIFDLELKRAGSWQALEHSVVKGFQERFAYLKERHHWLNFQNYLILPGIIYWTTVALLYLNPFDVLRQQIWIVLSTFALGMAYWYLKTIFYAHRDASRLAREMIFVVKLYGSYLAFAASLGIARYFGYGGAWFWLAVFLMSFLLMYQALFQHHFAGFRMLKFLFATGILLGAAGYAIYFLWNVNYYSGALVLAALYNTVWGIVHHKYIDENLTAEIVYEYLAVLFLILVIIFGGTNFAERI